MNSRSFFASRTVVRHLLRGVFGFGLLVIALPNADRIVVARKRIAGMRIAAGCRIIFVQAYLGTAALPGVA